MEKNKIYCGDCLDILRDWPDNSFDTLITDPPYGLSFMGKKWDYDVPSVEIWRECLRVLKPGGTLLCFAGSRTQHRMAVNVEDAGFILKDCIMWLYGSGFPKATDISKQLDKGFEREVIGNNPNSRPNQEGKQPNTMGGVFHYAPLTTPATPEAEIWNGWKSHGLKPAYEPILVAMKPNDGSYADNALKWGVSGLNIDGGRIESDEIITNHSRGVESAISKGKYGDSSKQETHQTEGQKQGRFPANIILDEVSAIMLDEQSGQLKSGLIEKHHNIGKEDGYLNNYGIYGNRKGIPSESFGDSGGASRFFYCAKASKAERNMGCEKLEVKAMCDIDKMGGAKCTMKTGSGNDRNVLKQNHHPTVKPLALMEYLCKLTMTPTGGLVLDPFCGSGTTCIACSNTGRDYVGIEMDNEYCEIARRRIAAAKDKYGLFE